MRYLTTAGMNQLKSKRETSPAKLALLVRKINPPLHSAVKAASVTTLGGSPGRWIKSRLARVGGSTAVEGGVFVEDCRLASSEEVSTFARMKKRPSVSKARQGNGALCSLSTGCRTSLALNPRVLAACSSVVVSKEAWPYSWRNLAGSARKPWYCAIMSRHRKPDSSCSSDGSGSPAIACMAACSSAIYPPSLTFVIIESECSQQVVAMMAGQGNYMFWVASRSGLGARCGS